MLGREKLLKSFILPLIQIMLKYRRNSTWILAHLLINVPRPGDSGLFGLQSQTVTCYHQSNNSWAEAIQLSALPKDTTSELAGFFSWAEAIQLSALPKDTTSELAGFFSTLSS